MLFAACCAAFDHRCHKDFPAILDTVGSKNRELAQRPQPKQTVSVKEILKFESFNEFAEAR